MPAGGQEPEPTPGRSRRGERRRGRRRNLFFAGSGGQLEHAVRAAGPVGGGAAWVRLGRAAGVDRSAFSHVADQRRPLGLSAGDGGNRFDDVRGLMGLAIAASRPSLAERQTARARGAALAADPVFVKALAAVGEDARRASLQSDIYYLWSLERVCVALGLRSLDGFDWYAHGARDPDRAPAKRRWLAAGSLGTAAGYVAGAAFSAKGEPCFRDRSRAPAAGRGQRSACRSRPARQVRASRMTPMPLRRTRGFRCLRPAMRRRRAARRRTT